MAQSSEKGPTPFTTGAEILENLMAAARAPLSEWPARYPGRQPMGYLCSYVPEEIMHAAGLTPVRLRGTAAPIRYADAHLQSFACALCRSTLDQVLSRDLEFLAGTVFAHTCDAMQALADLWRISTPDSHFVSTVMQPSNLGSPTARAYLVAELSRFRQQLADLAGRPIGDDDLRASIVLYDETRRLVHELQGMREQLSVPGFFTVLDAAQMMPRDLFNPLLAELLAAMKENAGQAELIRRNSVRLFLVGAVLDEPRLLDLIDETGALVVGDDLCSGSRHFHGQVGSSGDPIANLADYYLERPPCPTKFCPTSDSSRSLLEQVRQTRAGGVVFTLEKFCEPHAFDYALVQPALDRAGVPHLLLEMEQTPSLEGLRTRLQAFVEML